MPRNCLELKPELERGDKARAVRKTTNPATPLKWHNPDLVEKAWIRIRIGKRKIENDGTPPVEFVLTLMLDELIALVGTIMRGTGFGGISIPKLVRAWL
jgi:hypothetical protein